MFICLVIVLVKGFKVQRSGVDIYGAVVIGWNLPAVTVPVALVTVPLAIALVTVMVVVVTITAVMVTVSVVMVTVAVVMVIIRIMVTMVTVVMVFLLNCWSVLRESPMMRALKSAVGLTVKVISAPIGIVRITVVHIRFTPTSAQWSGGLRAIMGVVAGWLVHGSVIG